jgi:serine/threonine-protein kinase HipA
MLSTTSNRKGKVYVNGVYAGTISETDEGYHFAYDESYCLNPDAVPVSLTMPLRTTRYENRTFFPYFDGLIPEGWLLEIAARTWKIDPRDRMGLLLAVCRDCIGAVSVEATV